MTMYVIPSPTGLTTSLLGTSGLNEAIEAALSGSTDDRPTAAATGQMYFDTTLGYAVWWNGSGWVDSSGTSA